MSVIPLDEYISMHSLARDGKLDDAATILVEEAVAEGDKLFNTEWIPEAV